MMNKVCGCLSFRAHVNGFTFTWRGSAGLSRDEQVARNLIFFGAPIAAFFTVDRRLEVGSWFDCGGGRCSLPGDAAGP
jgi:hypothetical protein